MVAGGQFDIDLKRAISARTKLLPRDFDFFGIWANRGFKRLHVFHGRRQTVDAQRTRVLCLQIDNTNRMIVRVRDVEVAVRKRQSGGLIKGGLWSIRLSGFSCSEQSRDFFLL